MRKLVVLFLAILSTAACDREAPSSQLATPSSITLPRGFTLVTDVTQVCMVNDQFMGKPQIPVEYDGKTYFGCCAMCKERLAREPATRTAADPVTGQTVDKAKAIIVQDEAGKVLYFASEDTLRRYRG